MCPVVYLKARFRPLNWLRYEESRLPIRNEHCQLLCICRYAAFQAKPVKTANSPSSSSCCATIRQDHPKKNGFTQILRGASHKNHFVCASQLLEMVSRPSGLSCSGIGSYIVLCRGGDLPSRDQYILQYGTV